MDANRNDNPHIPTRLEGDLRAAFGGFSSVPSEIDRAVLGMAERVGAAAAVRRRRVTGKRTLWAGAGIAAAAAVIVMIWVAFPGGSKPTGVQSRALAAAAPHDLNGDGRVDMLDALIQAEQEKAGKGSDVNGDGKVDAADVDAIAMRAVKLGGSL